MRHCRVCWQTGHNKRTCPQLTDTLRKRSLLEQEDGQVDGHWTRLYIKRTGLNPDGSKAAQGSKAKSMRRCGWCKNSHQVGEDGYTAGYDHNRRTCQHRKEWYKEQKVLAKEYRTEMLERMKESGFGVGTLIKKECWDYFPDENGERKYQRLERILIVTGIHWAHVHQETGRKTVVITQDVAQPTLYDRVRLPLKVEFTAEKYAQVQDGVHVWDADPEGYEVLSPSGSTATKPWGWENGEGLSMQEPH